MSGASAAPEASQLCARLSKLSTGIVWDVMRVMGLPHQALSAAITGLEARMTLCGPAFCIKGQTWLGALPKNEPDKPQPRYEIFRAMYDGCVMVIDTGGYNESVVMGENFAISSVQSGCTGFVIDGAVRDAQALAEMKAGIFRRFNTPASSAGRWSITDFELPITMPGQTSSHVTVEPGDLILGDRDGVIVIPRVHAANIVGYAEHLQQIEEKQRAELLEGKDERQKIYERYDRFGHIKPVGRK